MIRCISYRLLAFGLAAVTFLPEADAQIIGWWRAETDNAVASVAGARVDQADDASGHGNLLFTPDGTGLDGFPAANNPSNNPPGVPTGKFSPTYRTNVPAAVIYDPMTGQAVTNASSFEFQDEGGNYGTANRLSDKAFTAGGVYNFATNDTTFEVFIKSSPSTYTAQANGNLFADRAGVSPFYNIFFEADDIRFFNNTTNGSDNVQTTLGLDSRGADATEWHHLAIVIDFAADSGGSDEMRVYFDYFLFQTVSLLANTVSNGFNGTGLFEVGNSGYQTGANIPNSKSSFRGLMDEIRITSAALIPDDFLRAGPGPAFPAVNLVDVPEVAEVHFASDPDTVNLLHVAQELVDSNSFSGADGGFVVSDGNGHVLHDDNTGDTSQYYRVSSSDD